MNAVGITCITLGVFIICSRGPLIVVPGATLRWFHWLIETNTKIRMLGGMVLILGAAMIWAGATEPGTLATVLTWFGWFLVGIALLALEFFPNFYREIASAILPDYDEESLLGWRFIGLLGVSFGALMVYIGMQAL